MKKKNYRIINENQLINYLKKLNFNNKESFNFDNDAAILKSFINKKIITTSDTIIENVDFFKYDIPQSIAQKIITSNLSDISSMGAKPYCYILNLSLPKYINIIWFKKFINYLLKLQKKYNFYLLGGDLSRSKQLIISATFFGSVKSKNILKRTNAKINDDIWITGNIGDSYIGLNILKNKILTKLDKKLRNYFINKYYFPNPCTIGDQLAKYCNSCIDISDGVLGDLKKILADHYGAIINLESLPLSINAKKIIKQKAINKNNILYSGDNYQLILTAPERNSNKIRKIALKNKIKITNIGRITKSKGIYSQTKKLIVSKDYFNHFA